jgi:hypothetical protein
VTADEVLNAAYRLARELRRTRHLQVQPASELAQRQTRDEVEKAQQAIELVPRIAGQPLVGAFAGQCHLVAAGVDLRASNKQRARRVHDGPFGRPDQPG